MRVTSFLLLAAAGLAASGCFLVGQATHVLVSRAARCVEEHAERHRNKRWAEAAWRQVCEGGGAFSEDYADGFKEGFAVFLFCGGCGEPPPLPPSRYRKLRYQTPQGYRAIEDWFAGYRHGAAAAHEGGFRQLVTGPTALGAPLAPSPLPALEYPEAPPPSETAPLPRLHLKAVEPARPDKKAEELPPPRPDEGSGGRTGEPNPLSGGRRPPEPGDLRGPTPPAQPFGPAARSGPRPEDVERCVSVRLRVALPPKPPSREEEAADRRVPASPEASAPPQAVAAPGAVLVPSGSLSPDWLDRFAGPAVEGLVPERPAPYFRPVWSPNERRP